MARLVECVPNFSEGRDLEKIDKIVNCFRAKEGVKLLDYSSDKDHNRTVVTVVGEPEKVADAVIEFVGVCEKLIDLNFHKGEHPRMGAVDVIPFIPIKEYTVEEAVLLSKKVAKTIAEKYEIPVYLYENSAEISWRTNLADIRKGEFEGLEEKMKDEKWKPDFGPNKPHKTFGAVVCGCRPFLCAFNVNLSTSDVNVAKEIAKKVRYIGGGLRYVKALGVEIKERNMAQVSMNLTDYTKTAMYRAFEMVKMEAQRYGVNVIGSEIIGLVPMQALVDCAEYYLQIENFSANQIIETRLYE